MSKKELWSKALGEFKDKKVVLGKPTLITGIGGRHIGKSIVDHQMDAYRYMVQQMAASPVPKNQPAAHPMLVFNQFDQYPLTEGWSINGLMTPSKYSTNTYGYCKANSNWYLLTLYRNNPHKNKGPWKHKWETIETDKVPREHQAACMLMAQFI